MRLTPLATALALLLTTALVAKSIPEAPAPQPGSARLAAFIGTWSGEAQMTEPGKPPVKVRVTIDCHRASGGWAVRCDGSFLSPEMNYLETDIFGYDAATQKVHLYSVTNAGEVHDHAGTWSDDARLALQHRGASPNGELTEDLAILLQGKDVFAFDVTTTVAGSTVGTMHGQLTKRR